MKKILHIIHGLNVGGAETFIYNMLQKMKPSHYRFDFAIQNPHIGHTQFKSLIEERGGKIYMITDFRKNPLKEAREISLILEQCYDYVHIHMNAFVNPIPAIVASNFNNRVIIHSHNTHNGSGGKLARVMHFINRRLFIKDDFLRIACGTEAGKWMFGEKSFKVANNAVNLDRFSYDPAARKSIRSKYGISNEFVIGHMGRFVPEKNQKFLIETIVTLKDLYPEQDVKLMLCGDGPMKDEIIEYSRSLGVHKNIIFTGIISEPHHYYSAFDVFALPSFFEGLAFVAVEAQAAGLSVVASDTNTKEIDVTNNVSFISLKESKDIWAKTLVENMISGNRIEKAAILRNSKYDMENLVAKMKEVYS